MDEERVEAWAAIAAFVVWQPRGAMWGGRTREEVIKSIALLMGCTPERLERAFRED